MRILHRWIAVATCVAAAACGSSNDDTNRRINETQIANGQAQGADLSNQFVVETSGNDAATVNGKIAGVVRSINQGEIAEANFILSVTSLGPIIDFANLMISDHTAADLQITMVVRDIGTGFITTGTSTSLDAEAAADVAALRGSADPDFDYLQIQVMDHTSASVLVEQMMTMTTDPELSSYLTGFDALLLSHRDRASFLLISF
jgi:predicted outer membrane protein